MEGFFCCCYLRSPFLPIYLLLEVMENILHLTYKFSSPRHVYGYICPIWGLSSIPKFVALAFDLSSFYYLTTYLW